MTDKDMELLENLLEEFCAKSDYCKSCPCRLKNGKRYFCYFGATCIFKDLKNLLTNK